MYTIGISGFEKAVAFKKREFPNLPNRNYRIVQGFDSAAALVKDGEIVAAAAEERFTGEKATGAFPIQAIQYCLKAGRLKPDQVDYIAHGFAYEPFKTFFDEEDYQKRQYAEVYSPEVQKGLIDQHFPSFGWRDKFVPVLHHLAHAASAFYPSGFENALILISDGMGEVQSMTVATGQGSDIEIITEIPAFHSLGTLYGVFTHYLGFYINSDEYNVMGLAPYGN